STPSLAPTPPTERRADWPPNPLPLDPSEANIHPSTASVEPNTSPTASDQAASQRPEEDRNSPPLSVILGGVGLLLALGLVVAITLRVRGRASADD
ncbi:hypothetical protein AB0I24_15370, partial [Brachybacterium paraconglomeratum]